MFPSSPFRGYVMAPLLFDVGTTQTAMGPGTNGFGTQLFLVVQEAGQVIKVDPQGSVDLVADLGSVNPQARPWSPTFDALGGYSSELIVCDSPGQMYNISPTGLVSRFEGLRAIAGELQAAACDPTGGFGGHLMVVDGEGLLWQADFRGDLSLVATGLGDGVSSLRFCNDDTSGPTLFIVDRGGKRLLALTTEHEPAAPAPLWMDLSPLGVEPVSLAVSAGDSFGRGAVYIADIGGDRIVRCSADRQLVQVFATGISRPTALEIPQDGEFGGTMVVTGSDSVWLIQPSSSDINHDGEVNLLDVAALMDQWGPVDELTSADMTGDGWVDQADLGVLLERWSAD